MTFEECISKNTPILMEGALGERLKREYGLKIDGTAAMAPLVYSPEGRFALKEIWCQYINTAKAFGMPFAATTPTRRANRERVYEAGFDESIIKANTDFLKEVRDTCGYSESMFIGGLMGCRGDAYTGDAALSEEDAFKFHLWQAKLFADEGINFLYAGIMPCTKEAVGMARAMEESGLPYIISFTIQRDGRLLDGTTINDAIEAIDSKTARKPLMYMTNCVHPSIVIEALSHDFNRTDLVKRRFRGIQANTSPLSYDQLDGAKELKTSPPKILADEIESLKRNNNFILFGGCCGTDNSHMAEIAKRVCL